jgi:hypothetical protein
MNKQIREYHQSQSAADKRICDHLARIIDAKLTGADAKVWHAHPVWFLDGNPIVGYSRLEDGIRLMFWSGADFGEPALKPGTGKFKDASILYTDAEQIKDADVKRWLVKAKKIQWDYKNLIKNRKLVRIA